MSGIMELADTVLFAKIAVLSLDDAMTKALLNHGIMASMKLKLKPLKHGTEESKED